MACSFQRYSIGFTYNIPMVFDILGCFLPLCVVGDCHAERPLTCDWDQVFRFRQHISHQNVSVVTRFHCTCTDWKHSGPDAAKQPQSTTKPPPFLTVGCVQFCQTCSPRSTGGWGVPGGLKRSKHASNYLKKLTTVEHVPSHFFPEIINKLTEQPVQLFSPSIHLIWTGAWSRVTVES